MLMAEWLLMIVRNNFVPERGMPTRKSGPTNIVMMELRDVIEQLCACRAR